MAEHVSIRVVGHLDDARSASFGGLAIARLAGGQTLISGAIADQTALHGLLTRVRDLGLPLRNVTVTTAHGDRPEETEQAILERLSD
jgi:hypothetical protein